MTGHAPLVATKILEARTFGTVPAEMKLLGEAQEHGDHCQRTLERRELRHLTPYPRPTLLRARGAKLLQVGKGSAKGNLEQINPLSSSGSRKTKQNKKTTGQTDVLTH